MKRLWLWSLLLSVLLLFASAIAQSPNNKGTKEQDTFTFTVSGSTFNFLDSLGTQTNEFEVIPSGSPATVSVSIAGCMRANTCSAALASTTSTTAILLNTTGGPYDYYQITASWTGGSSPTIKINRTGTVARSSVAPTTSSSFTGSPWLDFTSTVGGGICDNTTDDTTAFNAALTTLKNQGGGTLVIPVSKECLIAGQVTLPNDGGSPPGQKPIRITSFVPAAADARGVAPTNGSGTLNLTFNAANAKILTFGNGDLEIDHITLTDTAADCAAFVMTTSTVVNIHDVLFAGTTSGAACNDAVIFGGTGTVVTNTVASPFQGYGSRLIHSWFNKMRRIAYLQTYANGIVIKDNTIEASSGSNLANGAAIEINGDVSNADVGNKIEGNLIEMSGYVYPIKLTAKANNNRIVGNDCYDPGGGTLACVRVETGNAFNYIETSFNGSATAVSDVDGNDTYVTPISGVASLFSQGITVRSSEIRQTGPNAGSWFDILNTVDATETFWQLNNGATTPHLDLLIKPAGGTAVNQMSLRRNGSAQSQTDFGDSADTSTLLRTQSATADMKLESQGSGQVVWLCGGNAQCKNQVNNNGQLSNTASVGTAPFVITSTTPVANLTTVPTTYNAAGAQQTATHLIQDTCTLGTNCGITLSGSAIYTNATSYTCTCEDNTAINACRVNQTAGNGLTITGTGTDVIRYLCVGN